MRWTGGFGVTARLAAAALGVGACGRAPAPLVDGARTGWIVASNQNRVFYEIQGQGDTLILIHGGFVDRRMWDQEADELAGSYTVIRYDLRGFGRSDLPTSPYRPADDLLALYDALGIGRAGLVGLSMGGGVALSFTLAYPDRVSALVLAASPANGLPVPQEDIDRIMAVFQAGRSGGPDSAVALWLRHPMLAALMEKRELANRMEFLARENARFFSVPFWPFETEEPTPSERLGEVRVPTLVIWGDRDAESVQQNSAATAERIPGARTVVLRGAGHMVNMERPNEFLRAVRALLEEIPDA